MCSKVPSNSENKYTFFAPIGLHQRAKIYSQQPKLIQLLTQVFGYKFIVSGAKINRGGIFAALGTKQSLKCRIGT
jgi:hypothetical protein